MQNMPKGIPFFAIVWIIGVLMSLTYNGAPSWDTTFATNPSDTLGFITNANQASQQLPLIGQVSYTIPHANFVVAWFQIIMWQFPFLNGYPWIAAIFAAIGAMGLVATFMLIYGILRGNITFG